MKENLTELSDLWLAAKAAEAEAVAERRRIEDKMAAVMGVDETLDGTKTAKAGTTTIKVVGRINRRVDGDLLQEIAAEHGLSDHLSHLFRWKPEINAAAWKAADHNITAPLAAAITAKPGRPSFAITTKEEK